MTYLQAETQTHVFVESNHRFQGGGESGVAWEIGIDIYITIFFKSKVVDLPALPPFLVILRIRWQ